MKENFQKVYAMIDCNSFYCSCERLFRPEYRTRAVIVLSNNDGCAVARTQEAKDLGIAMGAPYFKIRELCEKNKVGVFSSNFSLYTNISDRVMSILSEMGVAIEVYSIDEAWIDITGISKNYFEYGQLIKERVEREVGIPVGVGIAPTKTLSKLANHIAKKSKRSQGVVDLSCPKYWKIARERVAVEDIWGIGRKSAEKLRSLGIRNAQDFVDYDNEVLIQKLLTKTGLQRKKELAGIACFNLELHADKKKVIRSSRTFGSPVYEKEVLKEAIASHISAAAEKLRKQESACSLISVFFRTSPFKNVPQYYAHEALRLESATQDTRKLIKSAWELVEYMYRGGYEYKKAGIELYDIVDITETQLSLLDENDDEYSFTLMNLMDYVNKREGPKTLQSLACGVDNTAWKMLRDHKSPRYTTSWWELPKVK
jgi:DNA polymerase V